MTDLFPAAAAVVLAEEGVYSDDPVDPGQETKWGISRAAHPEIPDATWQTFTRDDALAIYRAQYWDAHRCGEMPWPWALGVFDAVVNQGHAAVGLAQDALRVAQDGAIGPETLAAMATAPRDDFEDFLALRLESYARDAKFETYARGWFKRVVNIAMAATAPPEEST